MKKLRDLYTLPVTVRVGNSRRLWWAGHIHKKSIHFNHITYETTDT
jgi:hypothetical protein